MSAPARVDLGWMGDGCGANPSSSLPPFWWPSGGTLGVLGIYFGQRIACGLPKMGSIMYWRWWLPYMGSLAPKLGVVGTPCHCVFGTFRVFPCMDLSSPRVAQGGYPYRSLRYLLTFTGSGVAGWGMKARAGKKKVRGHFHVKEERRL
jgi:hypothetical protein